MPNATFKDLAALTSNSAWNRNSKLKRSINKGNKLGQAQQITGNKEEGLTRLSLFWKTANKEECILKDIRKKFWLITLLYVDKETKETAFRLIMLRK